MTGEMQGVNEKNYMLKNFINFSICEILLGKYVKENASGKYRKTGYCKQYFGPENQRAGDTR